MREAEPRDDESSSERLPGLPDDEVGCDELFDRLDELVELDLAGADPAVRLPGTRAHLDSCPECRAEYDSLRALLLADAQVERG
jgi:hypothetical protein